MIPRPQRLTMQFALCAVIAIQAQTTFGCVIETPDMPSLMKSSHAIFAGILVEEDVSHRQTIPGTLTVFQTFTVDVRRTWKGNVANRVVVSKLDVHEQCVGSRADVTYKPQLFASGDSIIIFAKDKGDGSYVMLPFGYGSRISGYFLLPPESLFEVEIREDVIFVAPPSGIPQFVPWSALRKVVLRTTNDVSAKPNIFWDLYSQPNAPPVTFPSGATGEARFIETINSMNRTLAGQSGRWDVLREKETMLWKAAASRSNASFVIWEATRSSVSK